MANRRSPEKMKERMLRKQQKKEAKNYVLQNSFHDPIQAETVCITKREAVLEFLGKKFEMVFPGAVKTELGEVLVDSRGNGSLQQVRK